MLAIDALDGGTTADAGQPATVVQVQSAVSITDAGLGRGWWVSPEQMQVVGQRLADAQRAKELTGETRPPVAVATSSNLSFFLVGAGLGFVGGVVLTAFVVTRK